MSEILIPFRVIDSCRMVVLIDQTVITPAIKIVGAVGFA